MAFKSIITFLIFIILSSCKYSEHNKVTTNIDAKEVSETPVKEKPKIDSAKLELNFKPKNDYKTIKSSANADREYFKALYQNNKVKAIDSASIYLYSKLLNDIVPHWYGTNWDFNGYTNTPNDGEIACGYFVSTTLRHLGFNLNRYKMAQQGGLNEAIALQQKSELKIYRGLSFKELKSKLNQIYADGIYFVGLDNHVGYVLIKDNEIYFLHSSYCDNKVLIELAETSYCFDSNIYVLAEINTNKNLIKKWIFNEALVIPNS